MRENCGSAKENRGGDLRLGFTFDEISQRDLVSERQRDRERGGE